MSEEVGVGGVIVVREFRELRLFDVRGDHVACSLVGHGAGEDFLGEFGELGPNVLEDIGVEALAEFEFLELLGTDRAVGDPDVVELGLGITCINKS